LNWSILKLSFKTLFSREFRWRSLAEKLENLKPQNDAGVVVLLSWNCFFKCTIRSKYNLWDFLVKRLSKHWYSSSPIALRSHSLRFFSDNYLISSWKVIGSINVSRDNYARSRSEKNGRHFSDVNDRNKNINFLR